MLHQGEIIVDNFAGGGGASTGIELAVGRPPDIAINHDPEAIAMHAANHPATRHYCENIWQVDPREACAGRPVGLAWFSPDCKHFSKAKGGRPVSPRVRGLAWVVLKWAGLARPRVIALENVEEFQSWGPLIGDRPDPARAGLIFRRWVGQLRDLGYAIEWRELRACDYGAPTIRKRLFVIARCDGKPIVWPARAYGPGVERPWRTAAECIDWTIPCPSIFSRKKPLAEATMRRIARGVQRYVIDAAEPFIVPITHSGDDRVHGLDEPLRTVTTAHRGEMALVVPTIVGCGGRAGQSRPRGAGEPFATITSKADACVVAAFLAQHNGGMVGHSLREPVSTIVQKGCTQALVTAFIKRDFGTSTGASAAAPLPTITCDGGGHASLVQAFLIKYYRDGGQLQSLRDPMHTLSTRDRIGLVTVSGIDYQIVDIGMRMLTPRELFRAQGFDDSYVIDPLYEGKPLTKTAQIRMCGNSVCPPIARAIVAAQFGLDQAAEGEAA